MIFRSFAGIPTTGARGVVTCLMTDLDLDPNLPGRQVYTEAVFGLSSFAGTFNGKGHCISNLYSVSEANGLALVGRVIEKGSLFNLSIRDCFIRGMDTIGGLCAINQGTIRGCSVTGTVGGGENVGGLCGILEGGKIQCCFSTACVVAWGNWQGTDFVGGGLCGQMNEGEIRYAYATGPVSGFYNEEDNEYWGTVGGLCGGCDDGILEQCYTTGRLHSDDHIDNGLCGDDRSYTTIHCFWDVNTTGIEPYDSREPGGVGMTTAEMKTLETYTEAGWVFGSLGDGSGLWVMAEGDYPRLNGAAGDVPVGLARVPHVQGLSVTSAQAALNDSGLTVRDIVTVASLTVEVNEVAAVSACVHGLVTAGTALDLYVSQGCDANGTEESPWPLACIEDLEAVNLDLSACYIMSNDLYCPADAWYVKSLISSDTSATRGRSRRGSSSVTFNGNNTCIHNLIIISDANYLGLMGALDEDGVILNLSVVNSTIEGGSYVGGLCGYSEGTIQGCCVVGTFIGEEMVGGICGHNDGGLITDCQVEATIGATYRWIGGLCGSNSGEIETCMVSGKVWGREWDGDEFRSYWSEYVGGLCGVTTGSISYCGAIVDVNGGDYVGGLCGMNGREDVNVDSRVSHCYFVGKVAGDYDNGWDDDKVAGLCGYQVGEASCLENCLWDVLSSGQVTGCIYDEVEPGQGWYLRPCMTNQMLEVQTYLNAGWDLVGDSASGTRDRWVMVEAQLPIPVQIDPNFTPYPFVGAGTEDNPYQIEDVTDLGAMWQQPEACYVLAADIDLEGISWYGPLVESFSGTLDGQGHVLSHLSIEGVDRLGVFGVLSGEVENLVIKQACVYGLGDYVGTICGINNGMITQCNVDTTVIGYDYVGGLCGENARGGYDRGSVYHYFVTDSHTGGSVVGHDYVGGISGGGYDLENCTSNCYVAGHDHVGKLVGD